MFWVLASAVLFAAALITFLPLLRGKTFWQPAALALIFVLPAASLWLYTEVGTPEAIKLAKTGRPHPAAASAAGQSDIDTMIDGLRARLTESPEDLDGWMLLARTLKTMQRYPEALEALLVARGIAPDNPAVMVELVEARVFVSADGRISADSAAMLERAVELDPAQQKGLWLLGIASAQNEDPEGAIGYWETLLSQLEPGSTVAQSVQNQINEANSRLGRPVAQAELPAAAPAAQLSVAQETSPAATVADGSWQGTKVRIAASEAARNVIPPGAVLFVVARSAGAAVGPPLGVRRVMDPVLPLDLTISDQDSMLQERKISLEPEIRLQARISLSGSPAPSPGDWQSEAVTVPLNSPDVVELLLDQQLE